MLTDGPPNEDEFELSLFGRGRGECVVVHLGAGDWIVVDSCLNPNSQVPVALDYLDVIGVNVETSVCVVLASHFDTDHVAGISAVFDRSKSARVCISAAERCLPLFQMMESAKRSRVRTSESGFKEYSALFDLAKMRIEESPTWVNAGQTLFKRPAGSLPGASICALSPSPQTQTLEAHELEYLLPVPGGQQKRPIRHTPNARSIVLWVEVGDVRVLLSGDLEATSSDSTGWKAVVRTHADLALGGTASINKVAHHGSKNAHSQEAWDEIIDSDCYAAIAPFAGQLPTQSDLDRVCRLTSHVYLASSENAARSIRREPAVEKTIREVTGKRISKVRGELGQIRIRQSIAVSAAVDVSLWGSAKRIST